MLAICCFVIFVGIAATPLNKVLLSEDLAESYGAKCLDGTPAGYYIREVRGSSDWVFFLQGAGDFAWSQWIVSLDPNLN